MNEIQIKDAKGKKILELEKIVNELRSELLKTRKELFEANQLIINWLETEKNSCDWNIEQK